jgi:hypothetical protein
LGIAGLALFSVTAPANAADSAVNGQASGGPGRPRRHELAALANAGINRLLPQRLAKYRNLGGIQPMLPRC